MFEFKKPTQKEIVEGDRSGDTILYCRACGSTVLSSFNYCPYCGNNLKENKSNQLIQPAPSVSIQIVSTKVIQNIPNFDKAVAEGKAAASGFQAFFIETKSTTGFHGYDLLQGQNIMFSNGKLVCPNQLIKSLCIETKKELITEYNPNYTSITIAPGLRLIYDICDEAGDKVGAFEKVFGNASFVTHTAFVLPNNRLVFYFTRNAPNGFVVVGVSNDLIAHEEPDDSFRYDSRSLVVGRSILKVKNEFINHLPAIFHAYIMS